MRLRRGAVARGQDELLQFRQLRVVMRQGGIGTATFGAILIYALLNRNTSTGVSVADAPNVETSSAQPPR